MNQDRRAVAVVNWWAAAMWRYFRNEVAKDFSDFLTKLRLKGAPAFVIGSILLNVFSVRIWGAMIVALVTLKFTDLDFPVSFWAGFFLSLVSATFAGYLYKSWIKILSYYFAEDSVYGFATAVRTHHWEWVEIYLRDSRLDAAHFLAIPYSGRHRKLNDLTTAEYETIKSDLSAFLAFRAAIRKPLKKSAFEDLASAHRRLWPHLWPRVVQSSSREVYHVI